MNNAPLDLRRLALDRSPSGAAPGTAPRGKRWISRVAVPLGILLGFLLLVGAAAGRSWLPKSPVTVVPVLVKRAAVQPAGATLFQAPGWIEPRPTAINVAALAPGVLEELLVVEGQQVKKGQPIAKLIAIDAELVAEQARNSVAIRTGEWNRAKAERDAAQVRVSHPVHLQVELADAESMLAKTQTEMAKVPFLIQAAEANAQFARSNMEGKQAAAEAIPRRTVQRSESEFAAADASLRELRQRQPNVQREVDTLESKVAALRRQLQLLIEERRQLQEAEAKVQTSLALVEAAKLQLRKAELAVDRNVVRAPQDGRVLRLVASPGMRVMGMEAIAGHRSSTVIEMYDPQALQVRVDVRLEDVPMVSPGQPVQIKTASAAEEIHGHVLQVTSAANIQKNTLEVKVQIDQPPTSVSPEMLVTASFLAPATATTSQTLQDLCLVPEQLVQSQGADSFVWIVDANDQAQRRAVKLGNVSDQGLVEIQSGLQVTDKLIASGVGGLRDGSAVEVTQEDQTMGM